MAGGGVFRLETKDGDVLMIRRLPSDDELKLEKLVDFLVRDLEPNSPISSEFLAK